MKPRATLLALLALALLSLPSAAQGQRTRSTTKRPPATSAMGSYQRTKLLAARGREASVALGSVSRRTLLTTGRLPAATQKAQRRYRR